jgi:hypothetical protein
MNSNMCSSYLPNSNFWKINWMATAHGHSVAEGGSSGSPLFNNNHRVIGQLYGYASCPSPNCRNPSADIANYGKFSVSWDNNTNPKRRLQDWLDPNNTGVTVLDGSCSIPVNFTNQIVTTDTTVTSDCDINVQNVKVQNGATLTLEAAGRVNIISGFEVELGSKFEIKK